MITSSSFRALQGQRVRLYLSILRSLVWFPFFKGFVLVRLRAFVLFVALLFLLASVGYLALNSRQQEFRLWW